MKDVAAGSVMDTWKDDLKKHFEIKKLWMYDQFHEVFEKNIQMQGFDLEDKFVEFLANEGIQEILFFPEPSFDTENVGGRILTIDEIPNFIRKYAAIWTNNHIASSDLTWIFTLSYVGDFLLSGSAEFVKKALKFLKEAGEKKSEEV